MSLGLGDVCGCSPGLRTERVGDADGDSVGTGDDAGFRVVGSLGGDVTSSPLGEGVGASICWSVDWGIDGEGDVVINFGVDDVRANLGIVNVGCASGPLDVVEEEVDMAC